MGLVLTQRFRPMAESGDFTELRFEATVTRGGFATEVPARGALVSALTGESWTDGAYREPTLVRSRRLGPDTTLKQRVSLVYRGRATYQVS